MDYSEYDGALSQGEDFNPLILKRLFVFRRRTRAYSAFLRLWGRGKRLFTSIGSFSRPGIRAQAFDFLAGLEKNPVW
jgi:hypothetical protein